MTRFFFAVALGWPETELLPRLRELELTRPCGRCAGSGYYDLKERIPCFKCVGNGDELPCLTRDLARIVATRSVAGELDAYLARRRRQAECRPEIPKLVSRCTALYRQAGVAGALAYWSDNPARYSVEAISERVAKGELDAETAHAVLTNRLERLAELCVAEAPSHA